MKLLGRDRSRWGMAFAMLFAVQLMVSAFCVVTPAIAADTQAHCHADNMAMSSAMQVPMEKHSMPDMSVSVCAHCDIPTTFLKVSSHVDNQQDVQLVAVISMPLSMAVVDDTQSLWMVKNHAPPPSSILLFQTTLRILI